MPYDSVASYFESVGAAALTVNPSCSSRLSRTSDAARPQLNGTGNTAPSLSSARSRRSARILTEDMAVLNESGPIGNSIVELHRIDVRFMRQPMHSRTTVPLGALVDVLNQTSPDA